MFKVLACDEWAGYKFRVDLKDGAVFPFTIRFTNQNAFISQHLTDGIWLPMGIRHERVKAWRSLFSRKAKLRQPHLDRMAAIAKLVNTAGSLHNGFKNGVNLYVKDNLGHVVFANAVKVDPREREATLHFLAAGVQSVLGGPQSDGIEQPQSP